MSFIISPTFNLEIVDYLNKVSVILIVHFMATLSLHPVGEILKCCHLSPGIQHANSGGVCDGHGQECQPRHFHVQHAVCMQYSLQDKAAIHHCHEQGQWCISINHNKLIMAGFIVLN